MQNKKISKEDLKRYRIKLLNKEGLLWVRAGDFIDCDTLLQSLLYAGYPADYENVVSDGSGFVAEFHLNGHKLGIVETVMGDHMVRSFDVDMLKNYKKSKKKVRLIGEDTITHDIAEAMESLDGEEVAKLYNSICSRKIKYKGDDVWQRLD